MVEGQARHRPEADAVAKVAAMDDPNNMDELAGSARRREVQVKPEHFPQAFDRVMPRAPARDTPIGFDKEFAFS